MKVYFYITGGFAAPASDRSFKFDCCKLNCADEERLKMIIQKSRFFKIKTSSRKRSRPDVEQYYIKIEDSGLVHILKFDNMNIPAEIKPLIDFLKGLMKKFGRQRHIDMLNDDLAGSR